MSDVIGAVFFLFILFLCFSCCGWCCKRKESGAIYSTPVIVTSTTHQPLPGHGQNYAVQVTQHTQQAFNPLSTQIPMPSNFSSPYNPTVYNPTTQQHTAPYPPPNAAQMYSPQVPPSAPMGMDNPPAYNEVVNNGMYATQQPPFNPNFKA